jgi:hypothetical protein
MVTFVTLFLSLISGVHPVQVAVDGPVVRVEILLDRQTVRTLTRPPWRTNCDFGTSIAPHELVAVAYDVDGNEFARARQLINLPRARAETRVVLESDQSGLPVAVRVIWEVAEPIQPLGVFAIFDGQVLQPDELGRYPLPTYDPNQVHIVSAEAQFPDGVTARSDVTFGGRYGSDVATELTAVPIVVDERPPTLDDLEGCFRARGRQLTAAAVERPGVKLFLVRDQAAVAEMAPIKRRQDVYNSRGLLYDGAVPSGGLSRDDDQLHFVVANPSLRRRRELYPTSAGIDLDEWRLRWLVTHLLNRDSSIRGQKLSSAVAVAGVQAAAEGAPRAVLLVLSGRPNDESRRTPDEVRSYLRSLRVPLFVWSAAKRAVRDWGAVTPVITSKDLRRAAKAVADQLDRQWIVWVEGNHMVNEVELTGQARGFRLAGS